MKVILGLGNPGKKYEATRHNVGWAVVDHLADVWQFEGWKRNGDAAVSSGRIGALQVRLVKPLTYMNLSGAVLRPYLRRAQWLAKSDLLVIVDDVALPVGRYRLRASGSAGGHNGLKSVEHALASREYARLRIGIRPSDERRAVGDLSNFVLGPFGRAERDQIATLMPHFVDAAELWLRQGIDAAMNAHNREQQST